MKQKFTTRRLVMLGMMTALVFVSNYARITMPVSIGGTTSFTLANIICCLSGLLLGPVGGLASGLGSMLYDLTNPLWAAECWITFITKGAMGLMAGVAVRKALQEDRLTYKSGLAGAAAGCLTYYILYFLKNIFYDGLLIGGLELGVAVAALPLKFPASIFNAAVAIVVAPPLALAIRSALGRNGLKLEK